MAKVTYNNLKDERKDEIIHTLVNLFYDRPISHVTVTQIVEALAISRGAFYTYFEDIYDAYYTMVKSCARTIHGRIMLELNQCNFIQGIENYLRYCAHIPKDSMEWKSIHLLVLGPESIYARRRVYPDPLGQESKLIQDWRNILSDNHFDFHSDEEALAFLYYIERLIINGLQDFIVNEWSEAELLSDFEFKKHWLLYGIKENKMEV